MAWSEQKFLKQAGKQKASATAAAAGGTKSSGINVAGWGSRSLGSMAASFLVGGVLIGAAFSPPPVDTFASSAGSHLYAQQNPGGFGAGSSGGTVGSTGGSTGSSSSGSTNSFGGSPWDASSGLGASPSGVDSSGAFPYTDGGYSGGSSGNSGSSSSTTPAPKPVVPPSIGHVFVVLIPGSGTADQLAKLAPKPVAARAKGKAAATYTLGDRGSLFKNFQQVSTNPVYNRIALLGGQESNATIAAGCGKMNWVKDATSGNDDVKVEGGVIKKAVGCVFPKDDRISTIADEEMSLDSPDGFAIYHDTPYPTGYADSKLCNVPAQDADSVGTDALTADLKDNPGVWFKSLTHRSDWCWGHSNKPTKRFGINRPLAALKGDLEGTRMPSLSFIVPSRCVTDNAITCPDGTKGDKAAQLNKFIGTAVEKTIRASATWKNSLIIYAWDTPPAMAGRRAHKSAWATNPGGLIMQSPYISRPGRSVNDAVNTLDLLHTIQAQLGLGPAVGLGSLSTVDLVADSGEFRQDLNPRTVK